MNVTGFGATLSRFESGSEAICHFRDRFGKKSEELSDTLRNRLFLELFIMILREFIILKRRYKNYHLLISSNKSCRFNFLYVSKIAWFV